MSLKYEKMKLAIQDAIEEAEISVKMDGVQNEFNSDLRLEQWNLEDPDAVVNSILGIVSDYIQEML